MNPIQCPQCCVDLGREVLELLTADELSAVNLHGLLLDVLREVERLDRLHARAIGAHDVEAGARLVKERRTRAVGR